MRKVIVNSGFLRSVFLCCAFFLVSNIFVNAQKGEELYNRACKACHTLGGGKTIGPDLIGINTQREKEWLIKFIRSSQTMIEEGDADAIAIFNEYMKILMPDQNFNDAEINQILQYIEKESGNSDQADIKQTQLQTDNEIVGDANSGLELFVGKKQFENEGASCIACHTVNDKEVYYGGSFAKDLTHSYKLMQKAGIESVLQYLSFPAMSDSYKDNPLTTAEIADLTSYLKKVSDEKSKINEAGFGNKFILYAFAAFILLLLIIELFWRNKKPLSVKDHIYKY